MTLANGAGRNTFQAVFIIIFGCCFLTHFVHEIGHKDESAGANLCYLLLDFVYVLQLSKTEQRTIMIWSEHLISFVVLRNVMPLFRVVLKMTLPSCDGNRM